MIFRENESLLFSKYGLSLDEDSVLHKRVDSAVLRLAADMDQQDQIKTINYWVAIKNIYKDIVSKMAINYHYNIDSIEEKLKSFDDTARPVWLFFENNQQDWLKAIVKYHLPAQDCFFVKDYRKMTQNFSSQFNWQHEFPYYFLFTRDGERIGQNTKMLSQF